MVLSAQKKHDHCCEYCDRFRLSIVVEEDEEES